MEMCRPPISEDNMETWSPSKDLGPIWILGNGPSLAKTPLDELIGQPSFAMNRIHLLYPKVEWRPTYYLCIDDVGHSDVYSDLKYHADLGYPCFFKASYANELEMRRIKRWPTNITYLSNCRLHLHDLKNTPEIPQSWHLPQLCGFGTGLSVMLQIAVMMGYDPLILLGCDLGFVDQESPDHPDPNHFTPNYGTTCDWPLSTRDATLIHAHKVAQHSCDQYGVTILNASLGGILEVHQRIDFQEALKCTKQ